MQLIFILEVRQRASKIPPDGREPKALAMPRPSPRLAPVMAILMLLKPRLQPPSPQLGDALVEAGALKRLSQRRIRRLPPMPRFIVSRFIPPSTWI